MLAMFQYLIDAHLVEFKDWLKIGTDPSVKTNLDLFWYVTKVLLIPDYAVVKEWQFIYLVEVKWNNNLSFLKAIGLSQTYGDETQSKKIQAK